MNSSTEKPVNVICLKYGTRYPADYVNKLYSGVKRHLNRPFLFHCCTDDPTGLVPEVNVIPFPENPGIKTSWPHVLVKLMLTQNGFGGISGPTLFLDVDLVIMDTIDPFFDYEPGRFCIIHNWVNRRKQILGLRPDVGNSSVFRYDAGPVSDTIYQTFLKEMHRAEDTSIFNTEQAFMTYAMKNPVWWPESWVRSYKWNCRPKFPLNLFKTPQAPQDCKILVFHGKPDPEEALVGYKGKKPHHKMLPAKWILQHWK
ncbi:MAG TPA: hypothetical protein DCX06_01505 [Opitutae bacterium]|nr:hypothetical protein [Opitutae bacterium]